MCGIAGFVNCNTSVEEISFLLSRLESRGIDATGMAYKYNNLWKVWKEPLPASLFIQDNYSRIVEAASSNYVFLHTRQATHGNPEIWDNNHPIYGNKYMMIHNGIVFVNNKYHSRGTTDSEQLLLDIEHREFKKSINEAKGSFALALWNNTDVWLARNYNPIFLYRKGKGFVFCSFPLPLENQIAFTHHNWIKLEEPIIFHPISIRSDYYENRQGIFSGMSSYIERTFTGVAKGKTKIFHHARRRKVIV